MQMKCYLCLKTGKKRKARTLMRGYALCYKHAKTLNSESFGR